MKEKLIEVGSGKKKKIAKAVKKKASLMTRVKWCTSYELYYMDAFDLSGRLQWIAPFYTTNTFYNKFDKIENSRTGNPLYIAHPERYNLDVGVNASHEPPAIEFIVNDLLKVSKTVNITYKNHSVLLIKPSEQYPKIKYAVFCSDSQIIKNSENNNIERRYYPILNIIFYNAKGLFVVMNDMISAQEIFSEGFFKKEKNIPLIQNHPYSIFHIKRMSAPPSIDCINSYSDYQSLQKGVNNAVKKYGGTKQRAAGTSKNKTYFGGKKWYPF